MECLHWFWNRSFRFYPGTENHFQEGWAKGEKKNLYTILTASLVWFLTKPLRFLEPFNQALKLILEGLTAAGAFVQEEIVECV